MKNVLVTGATDGIGRETASQLLRQDWHVLVHGRNEAKATSTVVDISRSTRRGKATPVWGDFSRMQEIVTLAEQIAAQLVEDGAATYPMYIDTEKYDESKFEVSIKRGAGPPEKPKAAAKRK